MSPAVLTCPSCGATTPPAHIEVSHLLTCDRCADAPLLSVTFPPAAKPTLEMKTTEARVVTEKEGSIPPSRESSIPISSPPLSISEKKKEKGPLSVAPPASELHLDLSSISWEEIEAKLAHLTLDLPPDLPSDLPPELPEAASTPPEPSVSAENRMPPVSDALSVPSSPSPPAAPEPLQSTKESREAPSPPPLEPSPRPIEEKATHAPPPTPPPSSLPSSVSLSVPTGGIQTEERPPVEAKGEKKVLFEEGKSGRTEIQSPALSPSAPSSLPPAAAPGSPSSPPSTPSLPALVVTEGRDGIEERAVAALRKVFSEMQVPLLEEIERSRGGAPWWLVGILSLFAIVILGFLFGKLEEAQRIAKQAVEGRERAEEEARRERERLAAREAERAAALDRREALLEKREAANEQRASLLAQQEAALVEREKRLMHELQITREVAEKYYRYIHQLEEQLQKLGHSPATPRPTP